MLACLRSWRVGLVITALAPALSVGCTTDFDVGALPRPDAGRDVTSDLGDITPIDASVDSKTLDSAPTDDGAVVLPDAAPGCGMTNQLCCTNDGAVRCTPGLICTGGVCLRCPGILAPCGDTCVDLSVNPRYCGRCETRCAAGEICTGGACVLPCPPGQAQCGSDCVQIASDVMNCGGCGAICARPAHAAPQCMSRRCQVGACDSGFASCDGDDANGCESNLATSATHCGGCGASCTFAHATATCAAGACVMGACDAGYGNCDGNSANGCEVNTASSVANCGACAVVCTAPTGGSAVCRAGVCAAGTTMCDPGMGDCDGSVAGCETDLATSPSNCGACGASCSFAHAAAACAAGVCALGACSAGYGNCDLEAANGCETDLRSSASHCGVCATACASAHGAVACGLGVCRLGACDPGWANCDGSATNGCEADLNASVDNCGGCGVRCAIANAVSTCTASACRLVRCNAGFADCDGNPANGCEVPLMTDTSNCGACRSVCNSAHATPTCSGGTCAPVCELGYGNCDGNPANGCESDLRNDPAHCGACSPPCAFSHSIAACAMGGCVMGQCSTGYADCNLSSVDGCEVDLGTDPGHCGACVNTCASGELCASGSCTVSCGSGLVACGTSCVDLQSSPSNCGACAVVCPSGPNGSAACAGGRCSLLCAQGFSDCDGNPSDGCEVSTVTSALNCGRCGRSCTVANAVSTCVASTCTFTCNPGFGNCDGDPANGCETTTSSDVNNCGGCGTTCPSSDNAAPVCTSGGCGFVCNAGFGDCNGVSSDGCETDMRDSVTNCGACGARCGAPNSATHCAAGVCVIDRCLGGYDDCDMNPANGCESRLNTTDHCGACTTVCSGNTNARATCSYTSGRFVCSTVCLLGYSRCGAVTGPCTTDLRMPSHCGGCTTQCSSSSNSVCRSNISSTETRTPTCGNSSCPSGTSSCGSPTTQCVKSATDPAHCGRCGGVCPGGAHAVPSCSMGACRMACVDSFNDCDGSAANGCESNGQSDFANCGGCSNSCSSGRFCSSGHCCRTNQIYCNGACIDSRYDDTNCGGCNIACTSGRRCVDYLCQ